MGEARARWTKRLPWALLAGITLWAAWLRWPVLGQGYSPDEFANLFHGSVWALVTDPESGVNPPLLRLIFNAPLPEPQTLQASRALSFAAGVGAVPMAFLLGRRASEGSAWAGLLAASAMAAHPYAVEMSGRFRAYGPFMLALGWHLWALGHAPSDRAGPARRRARQHVVLSAILLPWLHYMAVPLLLLSGLAWSASPRTRDLFRLYVPAGLLVSPMAWFVLADTSARVSSPRPLSHTLLHLVSLELPSRPALWTWTKAATEGTGFATGPMGRFHLSAALVALTLLGALFVWQRLSATERGLTVYAGALLASVVLLSPIQYVRSPVVTMWLVPVAPLLASLPRHLPGVGLPRVVPALILLAVMSDVPERLGAVRERSPADSLRDFAQRWRSYDALRDGRPIHSFPEYTLSGLYFYLKGQHIRADGDPPPGSPCATVGPGCMVHDGVVFRVQRGWDRDAPPDALVVAFEGRPPEGFGSGCALVEEGWQFSLWDCPGRTGRTQTPRGGDTSGTTAGEPP